MKKPSKLNPDANLQDMMDQWPEVIQVLLDFKLLCVGCVIAPYHTVNDACVEHDIDEENLWTALEKAVETSVFTAGQ